MFGKQSDDPAEQVRQLMKRNATLRKIEIMAGKKASQDLFTGLVSGDAETYMRLAGPALRIGTGQNPPPFAGMVATLIKMPDIARYPLAGARLAATALSLQASGDLTIESTGGE